MRDQNRAGSSVEECARKPRQRLRSPTAFGCRIAGREHDPIGVKLELRDLGCCQQAIVFRPDFLVTSLGRWRQYKSRLGEAFNVPSNKAMGSEMYDTRGREPTLPVQLLDRCLGRRCAQENGILAAVEARRYSAQLGYSFGKRLELTHLGHVGDPTAKTL